MGLTAKLTLLLTALLVLVTSGAGVLFYRQKSGEMTAQMSLSAVRGAILSTRPFGYAYESYYASGYTTFLAEASRLRTLIPEAGVIQIVEYDGEVAYDSALERDAPVAERGSISDGELRDRIKEVAPTVRTAEDGIVTTTFERLVPAAPLEIPPRVDTIVVPYLDELGQHPFSLVFTVDYALLDAALAATRTAIALWSLLAAVLAAGMGIAIAYWIVRPVRTLTAGARVLAQGTLSHRIPAARRDELGELAQTFNQMAADLDQSLQQRVATEKLAREVELAAAIQRDLLPKQLPTLPGLAVVGTTFPADQVGGDSFDLVRTEDERTILYLGDVTGHGLPAALVMAVANAVMYAEAQTAPTSHALVTSVNRILQAKTPANIFMTMTVFQWDEVTQELTYTGAGHDDFLIHRAATNTLEVVRPGGMILGAVPDVSALAHPSSVPLAIGDTLVLTTDGIPEARNPAGALYGAARLRALVQAYGSLPLEQLFVTILTDVQQFMAGHPQSDDITLILLRRTEGPAPRKRIVTMQTRTNAHNAAHTPAAFVDDARLRKTIRVKARLRPRPGTVAPGHAPKGH